MSEPSRTITVAAPPTPTAAGQSLQAPAGYEMLDEIGRGGMGVVYRARDTRLNREVAVKLLLEDYPADSAACDRFILESQITGQLQHPGVPAVHELKVLPNGRPFLAMKLVKGQTLHEHLKARSDPSQERGRFIAIFEQICQAVGYAHAHRVIHRDLKPANVMVGAFGEVQVMDWGLAKVLAPDARSLASEGPVELPAVTAAETPQPSATRAGTVMGTPAYMPPEQAGGEVGKLDPRSDVFGLGAILCQVLTGSPPYQGKDINDIRQQAARGELQDAFARLDGCGAEPELTALCKRCLSFQQEDRPADGGAVAEEIARIRQAAEERARKAELERAEALVREAEQRKRRRLAALVAVVLVAGMIGTSYGYLRAEKSAGEERLAKQNAERAAAAEKTANEQSQKRLRQIEKGNDILFAIFADLDIRKVKQGTEPLEAVLAPRLLKAAEQLDSEAVGDPLAVALMQNRLGRSLLNLGYAREAIRLCEKASATETELLGADHPDTLISTSTLAAGYLAAGQLDKALPLFEETLKRQRAKLGADHPDTLTSMNNLAVGYQDVGQFDKALPLLKETLRLRQAKLGIDHPDTLLCMNNLAWGYKAAGQLDKALPLFEETLKRMRAKLGTDHPLMLICMSNLAIGYQDVGQLDKALPLLEETLRLQRAKTGADHPDTLRCMNNLAMGYRDADQLEKALPLFEETLKLQRAKLGVDHPLTLVSMSNLATGYEEAGQWDKALPLIKETLRLRQAKLGTDHPDTLTSMDNLAFGYRDHGQWDKALPLFKEALACWSLKLGADHPDTLICMSGLAVGYQDHGQWDKALPLLKEALRRQQAKLGIEHPDTLATMYYLAIGYKDAGEWAKALPLCRERLAILEKTQPDSWRTFSTRSLLGEGLLAQQKYAEAEPLLVKGYEGLKLRAKQIPFSWRRKRLEEALNRLIQLAQAQKDSDALEMWQAEKAALTPERKGQSGKGPN